MELIASLPAATSLADVPAAARRAERLGFDVLHVSETVHDPFTTAVLALEHTERLTVRTSMVVAFPRSPMTTAYAAWDLAQFSRGRFQLGVATQVRGNIVGRYSAPWDDPIGRLRDYVASLRAIFTAFQEGSALDHAGPHYRFDRLQPYFNPGPLDCPPPSIWMGGVNRRMTELGGEVADGFVCHPTASHPRFLEAQVLSHLAAGAVHGRREDGGPAVVVNVRPLTGRDGAELDRARRALRQELAFLYSTPAYRTQLELFDLGDVGDRLARMARDGDWSALSEVLTDDVIMQLLPQGRYEELPIVLEKWYAGLCDGLSLGLPEHDEHDAAMADMVGRARSIRPRRSR